MPPRWTCSFYCEFSNNIIFDEKCGAVNFKYIWKKELVRIIQLPMEEDFQTVKVFSVLFKGDLLSGFQDLRVGNSYKILKGRTIPLFCKTGRRLENDFLN